MTTIHKTTAVGKTEGFAGRGKNDLLTKYVALCPHCNGMVALAVADTPDEEADALRSAADWRERGFDVYKRQHAAGDTMPRWCGRKCG